MKIEKAYSTDVAEVIDVETAYDLFWRSHITDKRNFECAFPDCDGPVTAANLNRLRQDMSVDPYYKKVGEHSDACKTDADTKSIAPSTDNDAKRWPRGLKSEELADVFGLSRPLSHAVAIVTSAPEDVTTDPMSVKRRKKRAAATGEPRPSTHYSLVAFVSKYHRYRSQGIDAAKFIKIKDYNIAYSDMFVPIDGQLIDGLSDYRRVYFGRAYIDEKPNGYRIGFATPFTLNGEALRPSAYIPKDLIQNAFSRKMSEAKFEELSKKKRPDVWVFVYSKPITAIKDGKTYINLPISNLDYFDFREVFC